MYIKQFACVKYQILTISKELFSSFTTNNLPKTHPETRWLIHLHLH